ncbi:hypothetical protein BGY98DRAFT_1086711 [Russula aff. rugulosa BPL654]|nr:hypothetical protein BGY98DRAFT_1086711 [Russula aff. rugulosa BPL654]
MSRSVSFKHAHIERNSIPIPDRLDIRLTDVESQLCNLLDDCTKHLAENGVHTSCRIAGGWVRDKLLGSECHDIDIALENMTVKKLPVKSVAVVKGNPGQSKHLETAKTTEYADDSRIPTNMMFGTPLEDARRRDMTMNSLFYNVHTKSVEDHCNQGLDDLKNGIIRTPLPPKQTFLDDPLRVIRCVRFASRFGFELVPALQESARDGEIQAALLQKVTRERVGEELDKMMGDYFSGRNPLMSLGLLDDLSLFPLVFHIPPAIASNLSSQPSSPSLALAAASIFQTFLRPDTALFQHPPIHPLILSGLSSSTAVVTRLYMACALTPYRGITYVDEKGKLHPAVEAVIREGLKVGTKNHYLDGIPALFFASGLFKSPDIEDEKCKSPSAERVAIECAYANIGAHWTTSLLFSLIQELVDYYDPSKDHLNVDDAAKVIEKYNRFAKRVDELGLQGDVDAKPILDGRQVWTGKVLDEVIKWQLGHPGETKEQCAEWLKEELAARRLSIEDEARRQRGGPKETATKKTRT